MKKIVLIRSNQNIELLKKYNNDVLFVYLPKYIDIQIFDKGNQCDFLMLSYWLFIESVRPNFNTIISSKLNNKYSKFIFKYGKSQGTFLNM